ncbi:MAG: methylmalonyl Co-A mutase-associated GTPase MeaB, partial [Aliidongia sp.]
AQAITLVESTRTDHRAAAEALIAALLPHAGNSIRLGISGVPGVGKSTFIETFGLYLVGQAQRVAVLAVDPSSRRTGGSILGDKTRMTELSRHEAAFIRPSPTGGTLGGVARRTRESIILCEAAGFDIIIVETVGVGQSETAVADMVDLFCLLLLPSAGDELQGLKKGIVELAELILVNKSDGATRPAALQAVADYSAALRLLRPISSLWPPVVLPISSQTADGIELVWSEIQRHRQLLTDSGERQMRRAAQAQAALWTDLGDGLIAALKHRPEIATRIPAIECEVRAGSMTPMAGARHLLALFLGPTAATSA